MKSTLNLGIVQLRSTDDMEESLRQTFELVRKAVDKGAELVAVPESFAFIGSTSQRIKDAQSLRGPIVAACSALARECGIWFLGGGFAERSPEPDRPYNTSFLLNAQGELVAAYRKIHLFDVDIPPHVSFKESAGTLPGEKVVVADSPWGKLGLSICYDLRFPELYRACVSQGARLVFVPSAFATHTGKDHWHVLTRARAIENTIFVAAPAQWGRHGRRRESYGRSVVVNPWGQVVLELSDGIGVGVIEVSFDELERIRREIPCLKHRRLHPPE